MAFGKQLFRLMLVFMILFGLSTKLGSYLAKDPGSWGGGSITKYGFPLHYLLITECPRMPPDYQGFADCPSTSIDGLSLYADILVWLTVAFLITNRIKQDTTDSP